jgi:putative modified peptide
MSTEENARAFVQRLSEDDGFRSHVEQDPVTAAAEYGFKINPASLPKDGVKLPAKQALKENLDQIASRFQTSPEVILIFML